MATAMAGGVEKASGQLVTSMRHLTTVSVGVLVGPGLDFLLPQLPVSKVELKVSPCLTQWWLLVLLKQSNGTYMCP